MNRTFCQIAAVIVGLAVILQALGWWILWDPVTFGPRGPGTELIADLFGNGVFPFTVALKLEYAVRAAILIGMALLAIGVLPRQPSTRTVPRSQIANPFE